MSIKRNRTLTTTNPGSGRFWLRSGRHHYLIPVLMVVGVLFITGNVSQTSSSPSEPAERRGIVWDDTERSSSAPRITPGSSNNASNNASRRKGVLSPASKTEVKVQCPPLTVIHGTLGNGSQDYPATSGQQTGRILNGLGNLNCGSSNPCSLNSAVGSRVFDAYTFTNSGSTTACVRVSFDMTSCAGAMQFSARLGSFDPANPCANYVGDAGAGFSGGSDSSFSFNVPAGQDFVVVVNENDPGTAAGCGYSLLIGGLSCQASCPPVTPINGVLGSGSQDAPAFSGQQSGRLLNGLGNFACGSSNPCSLGQNTGSRAFDAYTFLNPGAQTACVTVDFEMTGCPIGAAMQFSARLGTFDPNNPCTNYVGDAGAGFSGEIGRSFSFNVPAGQNFIIVVNENDPGGAVGCAYKLTISGVSCLTPCPPSTITGDIGKGSADYPSTSGTQTGRVSQNGVNSSCASPKSCPGVAAGGPFTFDAYEFSNNSSATACVTFSFPTACGINNAVHPVAYLGSFNPSSPCTNYLGDIGHSINNSESDSFSVNVPGNSTVVLVVHEVGTVPGCQGYSFSVTGLPGCAGGPCLLTCPANITKSNDPGQCGAVVTYSPPTASGQCGAITCSPLSGSFFPVGTTPVTCSEDNSSSTCSFTVTVNDTQPPTISCPGNITRPTDPNQCSAVVNFSAPSATDNCPNVGTPVCSPASGSAFQKGTTTVNCSVSDAHGNSASCSFTITVQDTQPPAITCPANVTAVTPQDFCTSPACIAVNFPAPVATDNCPGVTVVCNPPSGSCFALGATTVSCTATDTSSNTATCSFKVTVFDVCLQDDSNPSTVLLFNSLTGDYRFCCGGTTYTGKGKVTIQGCTITLEHNAIDRKVLGRSEKAAFRGSASLQSPPGKLRCTITDRDIRNNQFACS